MEGTSEQLPTMERLRWQCRRGLLELDLLLAAFLENGYSGLSDTDKRVFIRFLTYPDQTLQEWLMGTKQPEDAALAHMIKSIRLAL